MIQVNQVTASTVVVPGLSCDSDVKMRGGFLWEPYYQDNYKPLQPDQTICSYFLPTYRSDTRVSPGIIRGHGLNIA